MEIIFGYCGLRLVHMDGSQFTWRVYTNADLIQRATINTLDDKDREWLLEAGIEAKDIVWLCRYQAD